MGIVNTSSRRKQELGQKFAQVLGFNPGPVGKDGGIDGVLFREDGGLVYFQSKRRYPLNVDHAKLLYSDIMYHRAEVSVILSGVGYKETFEQRLFGHPYLNPDMVHLLTLVDLFAKTDKISIIWPLKTCQNLCCWKRSTGDSLNSNGSLRCF